jgi:hypothetical protein
MKNHNFCQSCHLPLEGDSVLGTEVDGSLNHEYCWHCYQNGSFTNPFATLTDMQNHVRHLMERHHEDSKLIHQTINILPELKRWLKPARV